MKLGSAGGALDSARLRPTFFSRIPPFLPFLLPCVVVVSLLCGAFGLLEGEHFSLGGPAYGKEDDRPIPVIDLHVDLPYQVGYKGRAFALGSGQFAASELVPAGLAGV